MKIKFNIGLSSSELRTIKKVAILSTLICALIVGGSWGIQTLLIEFQKKKKAENFPAFNERSILPIDVEAHKLLADRYLQTDNPEKAVPHLERIVSIKKDDPEFRLKLAQAFFESGYYQCALEQYTFLLDKKVPDSLAPRICAGRGMSLFYLGKHEESKEMLKECLKEFPQTADAACFLGQIESSREEPSDSAAVYFEQALKIDSTYVEAWYQLARFNMMKNNYMKAREFLIKALDINPLHAKSHSRLGMVYFYMGNPDLAKKSYQTALALNPRDFNTRYNLGELFYSSLGDTQSAFREFNEALKEDPYHCEANFKAGLICMKNNMFKESVRYFTSALHKDPSNIRVLMQLAVAFEKLGSVDKAIRTYNKILDVDALNTIARQKIKLLTLHP